MNEVCDRLAPTADLKDITIKRALPDAPVAFKGDGILLQAALQNILDNAIKYSSEGQHDHRQRDRRVGPAPFVFGSGARGWTGSTSPS